MKTFVVTFLILLITLPTIGQTPVSTQVKFVLSNGTYKTKDTDVFFTLKIINNSTDTVTILRPSLNSFNLLDRWLSPIGLNEKIYRYKMKAKGTCADPIGLELLPDNDYRPVVTQRDLLVIPPRQERVVGDISFANQEMFFCDEQKYTLSVEYEPVVISDFSLPDNLTDMDGNKIQTTRDEVLRTLGRITKIKVVSNTISLKKRAQ